MISSFPRFPTPLQFSARFKTIGDAEREIEGLNGVAATSGTTAVVGMSMLPLTPAGLLPSLVSGGSLISTLSDLEKFQQELDTMKAAEPAPPTPEQAIQQALKGLDADRAKQIARKDEIIKALAVEEAKLTELRTNAAAAENKSGAPLSMTDVLEQHRRQLEIQNQETLVQQMKANAEAAVAIDNRFEAQMQEMKKKYLTMFSQLQQIEQNKKMLEMQKNLEQLKGSEFQSPQLKNIQEQIDTELNKSSALVESFISDAEVLGHLQKEEQAALIQALKQQSVGNDTSEVEKKE